MSHLRTRWAGNWQVALSLALIYSSNGALPAVEKSQAAKKPSVPTVDKLITQLGHRDSRVRDRAQRALDQAGPSSLPLLLKARKVLKDAEIQRRLDVLIPALEKQALLAPTLVSLKLLKRPLSEALNQLSKQTGFKIQCWNSGSETQVYSFRIDKAPFWEALDEVCKAGGLVLRQTYTGNALRVNHEDAFAPYVSYNGPFRFSAGAFNYNRTNTLASVPKTGPAKEGASETLIFTFTISCEPRLALLSVETPRLLEAFDDLKNPVKTGPVKNPDYYSGYSRYTGNYRQHTQQTQLGLTLASRKAKSLSLLRGEVPVTLLAGERPSIVIDKILDLKKKQTFKAGKSEIDIVSVTQTEEKGIGKVYLFKIEVREGEAADDDSSSSLRRSLRHRLALEDAKGNPYRLWSTSYSRRGNGGNTFTVGFLAQDKVGPPARFILKEWIALPYVVKFEFKNLPLP